MIRTLAFILLTFVSATAGAEVSSVYVWDFATREGQQTDLTKNLTREFEEALTSLSGRFAVLNGRDPNRFLQHRKNVATIQSLAGASRDLVAEMEAFKVDQVIFGEVYDDAASGELVLTITFETLEGKKVLIKSGSMKRGLQNDRNARIAMTQEIVSALGARTQNVHRQTSGGFIFELDECNRASRTITCSFTVTNDNEDRYLEVYSKLTPGTRLFDDQNNQLLPADNRASVTVANQTRNTHVGTKAFLPASIPTQVVVTFDKASTSAVKIVRLDLSCQESDHDKKFTVTFKNIEIKDA